MSDSTGGWAAATTEGLKALREFGAAIAEPIREITGMASDHLKVVRFERQLRLVDRVKVAMRERGITRLDRHISLNMLLPLLEHASLEEDDELQDIWARMLVNAGDIANPDEVRRAFVSMLAEMTAFDVKNLAVLDAASPDSLRMLWTPYELEKARDPLVDKDAPRSLSPDAEISVGNLLRLGCVLFEGAPLRPSPNYVTVTALGRAFVRACTQCERS